MHVSDRRRGASTAAVGSCSALRQQVLEVERQRDHVHAVPVRRPLPLLARAVGVDLDAQAVRVAQVQRLGYAVVGRAFESASAPLATRRTVVGERGPRGVKPGDVEQAGAARRRRRRRRAMRGERERRMLVVGAEQRPLVARRAISGSPSTRS